MRISSVLLVFSTLLLTQLSFGAACPASTSSGIGAGSSCTITGTASTIQLNLNSGFTDATNISAVGGNNGLTIGEQRTLSFIKATEILADNIVSSQVIIVDANFSLLSCNTSSATLGSAGASTHVANVTPMPVTAASSTFYPIGLINNLGNTDYQPGLSDITSQFNSNIGNAGCLQASNGWYYGFDAPPSNYIGFTTVLLHEMTHGLGFASLVNASTGVKPSGLDDVFSNKLYSKLDNSTWALAGGLSNAERAAAAVSSTGLLWNGSYVNTQAVGLLSAGYHDSDSSSSFTSGDKVQMYAPNPIKSGSSVSHFDTAVSPNEIMEPQYTAGQLDLGLALYLLKDIGWAITPSVINTAPTITAVNQSTNEDITKIVNVSSWASDADGDTLTYSINSSCATNITCSINANGTNLTMVPTANHNGGTHSITVNVADGKGGTASDTFNLNVIAQNDDPVIAGVPNQVVKVGEFKDIDLSGYASDVDDDGLTFSKTACGANLTCTFVNATTIRITANGGAASTVSVTVEANDGNGGTNTDTFDVSITSLLPSTTIEVGGLAHNNGDAFILLNSRTQINVNNGSGNYSYRLNYNSSDVSSLISSNATGLTIALPASGEFAGDYTLVITDSSDGDIITITVTRPVRLNWSAKAFLNGDTLQTLSIEGGAIGTVYSLVQSASADLIFRDNTDASVTTVTATDDADNFNVALIHLDSLVVADISNMTVTVQSSYDDVVERDVKVHPSSLHSFTVKSNSGEVLKGAIAKLNGAEILLEELNVAINYSADINGKFTVLLPDTSIFPTESSYAMNVSLTGYTSEALSLNTNVLTHDVVLSELINGITLVGKIKAQGGQNLLQKPPIVTIIYGDEARGVIPVEVTSATRANFSYEVDLNSKTLSVLSISQDESVTVDLNISNISQSKDLFFILLSNISVDVLNPIDIGGSGSFSGGSMLWFSMFLLIALLTRLLILKRGRRLLS